LLVNTGEKLVRLPRFGMLELDENMMHKSRCHPHVLTHQLDAMESLCNFNAFLVLPWSFIVLPFLEVSQPSTSNYLATPNAGAPGIRPRRQQHGT
jgi:hypothetical protein